MTRDVHSPWRDSPIYRMQLTCLCFSAAMQAWNWVVIGRGLFWWEHRFVRHVVEWALASGKVNSLRCERGGSVAKPKYLTQLVRYVLFPWAVLLFYTICVCMTYHGGCDISIAEERSILSRDWTFMPDSLSAGYTVRTRKHLPHFHI